MVSLTLLNPLQTILDGGFRKAMKVAGDWATSLFTLPQFAKVIGNVKLATKAVKPLLISDPVVTKAEAPVTVKVETKPKEDKKPVDNVESLPPTSFDLYSFKTFFVNHLDKKGEAVT